MSSFEIRNWIGRLKSALGEDDQSQSALKGAMGNVIYFLRLTVEEVLPASDLIQRLENLRNDDEASSDWLAGETVAVLDEITFRMDLAAALLRGDEEIVDGPDEESIAWLTEQLVSLRVEAETLGLPDREFLQFDAAMERAIAVLQRGDHAQAARDELESLLGRAVSKAAKFGPARSLWHRLAEVIILADAAFNLGTGLVALRAPDASHIEVTCNVRMLELEPGPVTG